MSAPIVNNPLAKHFRQPAIYLKLPSGGKFYPEGTLDMPVTGEIPIYPMTVRDDLSLKTPDALMNGQSMCDIIQSCCPSIKNPWDIPLVDLDTILIAIRIASYGESLDITSTCPSCKADNEHTVDLRKIIDFIPQVNRFDQPTLINGLVFTLQPQTFNDINRIQKISFEQQKILMIIGNSDLTEEEKKVRFQESFDNLTNLNVESIVSCIKSITTDEGVTVTESFLIKDFLEHTDRTTYDSVKKFIEEVVSSTAMPPVEVQCTECEKIYSSKIEFNQSNFFG